MSTTPIFIAPRPLIVGAPLNPAVSNYSIAVGYKGDTGPITNSAQGTYQASVTEDQGYITWSISISASSPLDIPSGKYAYVYAYDPSSGTVLDFVAFTSPGIQQGQGIIINVSSKIARCVYKALQCTSDMIISCTCPSGSFSFRAIKETTTYTVNVGLHSFNVYVAYALANSAAGIPCDVGTTASCKLMCGNNVLYDLGSFTVTAKDAVLYYGCINFKLEGQLP